MGALPIEEHLGEISALLAENRSLVLEAPPGSGKTTLLPLHLLNEPWMVGKRIVVLQPRRLAARNVAARMAELLREPVGATVGYRMRLDSCVSAKTRIEIVTEGLLTRRLLATPDLPEVGLIIFDEFHERSIHADLALALTIEVMTSVREDLKLIVMSATIGTSLHTDLLPHGVRYTYHSAPHDVAIHYTTDDSPSRQNIRLWDRAARTVRSALERHQGDVLAFLPGSYEIERTREILASFNLDCDILPLYGELPYLEQQQAILPSTTGRRRVVLATNIAETSLTIEGIRIVVDTGSHRISRFDLGAALPTLSLERITQDAAAQRAGRAGRTSSGVCIRLWSADEHRAMRPHREPEITRTDLTPTLLDLAVWGVRDFGAFGWITPPTESAMTGAREVLLTLGAITTTNSPTQLGHLIASLGTHPRLGRMAIEARNRGLTDSAAELIAILEDRDPLHHSAATADISTRIAALHEGRDRRTNRTTEMAKRWRNRIENLPRSDGNSGPVPPHRIPDHAVVGFLLAVAFPDRIAKQRDSLSARYLLASGQGASLREGDQLLRHTFLVACSLHHDPRRTRIQTGTSAPNDLQISLAAPLDPDLFDGALQHLVTTNTESDVDSESGQLRSRKVVRCGAICLKEDTTLQLSSEQRTTAFFRWLTTPEGFSTLPWCEESIQLRERIIFSREIAGVNSLPDVSDGALREKISEWLVPFIPTAESTRDIKKHILLEALNATLTWEQTRQLNDNAPLSITLPNGKSRRLQYCALAQVPITPPVLEATIQELFGLSQTPVLGPRKIHVILHILSPARRPMQVTSDLASFWRTGYTSVRKELRGRYPKHRWPEDPTIAEPTIAKKR